MTKTANSIPALPCMCASFRRATRALTQAYDDALRPLKLRATQFTLLQVLARAPQVSQAQLGLILAMDSTSLTRTLHILRRRGWITRRRGLDRREWKFGLSESGAAEFKRALPHWQRAQALLRRRLGPRRWNDLMKWTNEVTSAATE